jgi:hypothetical protein
MTRNCDFFDWDYCMKRVCQDKRKKELRVEGKGGRRRIKQ